MLYVNRHQHQISCGDNYNKFCLLPLFDSILVAFLHEFLGANSGLGIWVLGLYPSTLTCAISSH